MFVLSSYIHAQTTYLHRRIITTMLTPIPGGHTDSKPEKRTPDGASTISSALKASKTD